MNTEHKVDLSMKRIDGFRLLEVDGSIIIRCYTGHNFVDAEIDMPALALLLSDGTKLLCHAIARHSPGEVKAL